MSGRIIPAISEERAGISKNWAIAHILAFDSWPQNCHGAGGCVILLADVSWKAYTEAQGLVEVDLLAILNLLFSPSSWLTLCDLIEYSPPGSCVHEISQARILEWVAISFCRGSSQTSDWTHISCCFCIAGRFFTSEQSLSFFYRLCPASFPSISVWVRELHLADRDLKIPVPRPVSSWEWLYHRFEN